ncbi:hypothetical protein K469DRAFT_594425, partial [Zopfia rhizophila CBS 207.26]
GDSPINFAVKKGYDAIVELLLQHGTDPNDSDGDSLTPLHLAARIIQKPSLLKSGADPFTAIQKREKDKFLD